MKSAFIPFDERLALIDDVIKPGYAALQRLSQVGDATVRRRRGPAVRLRLRVGVQGVDGVAAGAAVDQVDATGGSAGRDEELDGAGAAQLAQAARLAVGDEHGSIVGRPATISTIDVLGRHHQQS